MAGKPVATLGSMHVCPMATGTVPHVGGPVSGPGVPTVLMDNKPTAVVGDMCVCCGPPDTILQGAAGVLIDGKPLALMGSMTAHQGQITIGIPTITVGSATPSPPPQSIASLQANALMEVEETDFTETEPPIYTGCVENPLIEDSGKGPEESKEVKLKSTSTWEDLNSFADEFENDKESFVNIMQLVYSHILYPEAFEALHSKLLSREINPLEIEVVKNHVVNGILYEPPLPLNSAAQAPEKPKILGLIARKQAPIKRGKNKIIISENRIRSAAEDASLHEKLNEKIEEAYEQYIGYLLQYEFSPQAPEQDSQAPQSQKEEIIYHTGERH